MKLLITLKNTEKAKQFMEVLDHRELSDNLDFYYPSNLDLTLKDKEIYISFFGNNLWVENEDFILLRVPMNLIHDFIVKESD